MRTTALFPDLENRVVLITGGGSGIGAALVDGFARQGAKVAFIDIAEAESRALVERLSADVSHPILFRHADLRDVDAIRAAISGIVEELGPVRVLLNNAGWDDRHDLGEVSADYWDNNQAANLRHVFFVSQAVVPSMRTSGGGAIVNMSSISFMLNMPDVPAYAAAKAGIIGLTKSLAGRLGPDNIRVNCVLPGMIVTERQRKLWQHVLDAEALVGPCLFLASDCAAAMTAQSIIIDGGIL
jgi:NAD(P)-dependent dehydrogenase (short-subunit alcohol dehydrogenase family)